MKYIIFLSVVVILINTSIRNVAVHAKTTSLYGLTRRTFHVPPNLENIDFRFKEYGIVPQFFHKPPKQYLKLILKSFPGRRFSNYLMYTTEDLQEEPTSIKWNCVDNSTYYTLFFSNLEEIHHEALWNKTKHHTHWWLVVNIHDCDVWKGDVIIPYKAPQKEPMHGGHLNVYFLYEQPGKLNVNLSELAEPEIDIRESFTIHEFVRQYQLGDLEAGNFFGYYGEKYKSKISRPSVDPNLFTLNPE